MYWSKRIVLNMSCPAMVVCVKVKMVTTTACSMPECLYTTLGEDCDPMVPCDVCGLPVYGACTITPLYQAHSFCCRTLLHHQNPSGGLGNRKLLCHLCVTTLVCPRVISFRQVGRMRIWPIDGVQSFIASDEANILVGCQ